MNQPVATSASPEDQPRTLADFLGGPGTTARLANEELKRRAFALYTKTVSLLLTDDEHGVETDFLLLAETSFTAVVAFDAFAKTYFKGDGA